MLREGGGGECCGYSYDIVGMYYDIIVWDSIMTRCVEGGGGGKRGKARGRKC